MITCKICGASSTPLFETKILNKYDAAYNRCTDCGFIQTDEPFWLAEAYSSAINDIDLGPVNRAITFAPIVEGVILTQFDARGKFLDFGGGYGLFVRVMRDRGFDFSWLDAHCENIFARHFPRDPEATYDLLTAFEVFEHLADPIAELSAMLTMGGNVLFSTELVPAKVESEQDWPYFGPDHGQHIAFYTLPALKRMADRFGLCFVSDGFNFHMFSQKPMSEGLLRLFVRNGYKAKVARKYLRYRHRIGTLLMSDFLAVSGYSPK
jgi:hypothetical protein